MTFKEEQLVIFAVLLGVFLGVALIFTGRVIYLALSAPCKEGRLNWTIAAVFGAMASAMCAFQIWRIILRF